MKIFSYHNSKVNNLGDILGVKVGCFETSVGYSCPCAGVCRCYVDEDETGTRRLTKAGPVRCFASMAEIRFPEVFAKRRINMLIAKSDEFYEIAEREFRWEKFQVFRPHSAGDYLTIDEYKSWRRLAAKYPEVMFFGYTKSSYIAIDLYLHHPMDNYKVCYSWGGSEDDKVIKLPGFPICYIKKEGLYCPYNIPVINLNTGDDYQFITSGQSFVIPYH